MPFTIFSILIDETKKISVTLPRPYLVPHQRHWIQRGGVHRESEVQAQNVNALRKLDSSDSMACVFASSGGPTARAIHILVRPPEGELCGPDDDVVL